VGAIEKPDKPLPSRTLIAAVDVALEAGSQLIGLWRRAYDAEMKRRELLKNATTVGVAAILLPSDALDEELEIVERITREQPDYISPQLVDELERQAATSIVDYEVRHSAVLAPELKRWNHCASRFLVGKQHPSELKRLQAVGCEFSGVLSQVSRDLGQHDKARLYALESFARADKLKDPNLRAWSCGMLSRAAYGAGDFAGAVDLARLPGKQTGDQTARLALDEAVALAKMGDRKGVANAVERGMSSTDTIERTAVSRSDVNVGSPDLAHSSVWACHAHAAVGDLSSAQKYAEYPLSASQDVGGEGGLCASMTLGPYNPCRAAYFAASALAPVDVQAAYGYAEQVLVVQDRQGVPCPVKRIEMGTALATAETGRDLARAADLVTTAIGQLASLPLATGITALREFVAKTGHLRGGGIRQARQLALGSGAAPSAARP
jgi:hypothetical protein